MDLWLGGEQCTDDLEQINTANMSVHSSPSDSSPLATISHHFTSPQASQETPGAASASTSSSREPPGPPNLSSLKTADATPLSPSGNPRARVHNPTNQRVTHDATDSMTSSTHTHNTPTSPSKPSNTSQSSVTAPTTISGEYDSAYMSKFSPSSYPLSGGKSHGSGFRRETGRGDLGGVYREQEDSGGAPDYGPSQRQERGGRERRERERKEKERGDRGERV